MMRFGPFAAMIVLWIGGQADARGRRYVAYPVYPYPGVIVAPVVISPPALRVMPSAYIAPFSHGNIPSAIRQVERFVRIENKTGEKLTVSLLCRTRDENGRWTWLPEDPEPQARAMTFNIEPESVLDLTNKVSASRVRIWAQSTTQNFSDYQSRDLLLVPEPEGFYLTSRMETFTHAFGKK